MKGTDVMGFGLLSLLLLGAVGAWAFAAGKSETHDDRTTGYAVQKSEKKWRAELSSQAFRVLRKGGTERAFTGRYWDHKADGVYHCGGCGVPLFHSKAKFKSGTGWPSYTAPVSEEAVEKYSDRSYGMVRTEVRCATCGGHLGHVFPDGPPPTGLRYCINSAALSFSAADSKDEPADRPGAARVEAGAKEEKGR